MPLTAERRAVLERYLAEHGLKSTQQRDAIIQAFFASEGEHVAVEDILQRVRGDHPRIGYATVYRTLKLLKGCGLAVERHFGDGPARYEVADAHHHDHLICVLCGKIVEFENSEIERLQDVVADRHGFAITHHKMELYGRCPECRVRRD